jgi:hypothetical protein
VEQLMLYKTINSTCVKGGTLVLMRELVYFIKGGAYDSGKMWVVEEWRIDRMYGSLLIEALKTIHFQKRLFFVFAGMYCSTFFLST